MASNEGVRQVLLEQIADLPEEQLQDVLLFINFLSYSRQQATAKQSEVVSGTSTVEFQDPLREFIGAVSHSSMARNLDEAIYPDSSLVQDWLKPEEEAAWCDL